MAHQAEPMDIDGVDSDFDNKENTFHHSNVLPCTEKGYEELDVSELNMKLRYSITPASSPMSKSYTACLDNRHLDSDDSLNFANENGNLTRSLNSTITKNDSVIKTLKGVPLQTLSTEKNPDSNRNSSVLRQLDTTVDAECNNITVTINTENDIEENLSLPSSSSSLGRTPEATTPTKESAKSDGGSPIIRGLKSVLNMFRSSQSPIPPVEDDNSSIKQEVFITTDCMSNDDENSQSKSRAVASTPVAAHRTKDGNTSKRSSPYKESIVFNEDLEKELQWTDETTIIFSQEKIPIHKLFFQSVKPSETKSINTAADEIKTESEINLNSTVEYMDISFNDSDIRDKTATDMQTDVMTRSEQNVANESDSEFLDCETTFTKNESQVLEKPADQSTIPIMYDVSMFNLNKDTSIINEIANISTTNEVLKASEDILEGNPSLNLNKTVENNSPDTKLEILNDNEQGNLVESNVNLSEFVKANENPIINDAEKEDHTVEQILTVDNKTEIPLEFTSQNKFPESEEEGLNKQTLVNITVGSELVESHLINQNKEVDKDIPMELIFGTQQNNVADDIKTVKAQDISPFSNGNNTNINLCVSSETDILTENLNITEHVNNIANCVTLCDESSKPQTPLVCGSGEEIVQNSLQVLCGRAEEIQFNDSSKELPSDIPLPIDDDIEVEFNKQDVSTNNNGQGLCSVIQDDIDAKKYLDYPEKTQAEPRIDDKLLEETVDNLMPEMILSSNITEKTEASKSQNSDLNAPHEVTESCNIDERTEDLSAKDYSEQTYDEIQQIQLKNNNTILSDVHILPDLINKLMPSSSLETVEQHEEVLLGYSEQAQPVLTSLENTPHTTMPNIPETIPVNMDTEIAEDVLEPNSSEKKNDTSCILSNNEMEPVNKLEIESDNHTEMSKTICNEEVDVADPKVHQAEELLEQIKIKKEEKQLQFISNEQKLDNQQVTTLDDGIFVSETENVEGDNEIKLQENVEAMENTFNIQTTNPSSPPITSKGYNFNFDDIEDPFSTKIRMSPAPEYLKDCTEPTLESNIGKLDISKKSINKSRRRSQPERKKPTFSRKKANSTFDSASFEETSDKKSKYNLSQVANDDLKINQPIENCNNIIVTPSNVDLIEKHKGSSEKCNEFISENVPATLEDAESQIQVDVITTSSESILENHTQVNEKHKSAINSMTALSQIKTTASSEQSIYYSAGASSNESMLSRNVFNLPEIDDMNFNPFATKSKMRQSPPPALEVDDPFATRSKMRCSPDSSMVGMLNTEYQDSNIDSDEKKQFSTFDKNAEDKMETELMEKDSSNMSSTTCSSKNTDDKNLTVREVNTEDEDTVEGPFLEEEEDHNIDKISDIGSENIDMMQFTELPVPQNEENLDDGELFIDAEAFEFLLNQNKSNVVADSGKESLFLKFDPLFAKRISSNGVLAALNKLQKRQSTPAKTDRPPQRSDISPIPGPSTLNVTYEGDGNRIQDSHEDLNVTVSKPTMVVNPAVNPVAAPRNKSLTPIRSNRRSITFTSPAMAVIDRLLSLSANNSLVEHETTIAHVSREQNDAEIALTQLRELLAEKEIHVYNLRSESKELKDRLATLESQMKILETDSHERLKRINELNGRLVEKTKINKSMAAVVEEYERTIASLIAETEQDKKRHAEERIRLINERDEQTAHLASMEVSFSDLHSKYEKSKQIILSCKANEDTYKKSIQEFQDNLTKMQSNYELLKQHATSKLNHANQELEKMNRAHEAEVLKLNAMVKRKDLDITSLEETLAQKTKANEELAAICDELINKVG